MDNINAEMERVITKMREVGKLPAPSMGGKYNNLLEYNRLREYILEKFLEAYDAGYRLVKEALKDE